MRKISVVFVFLIAMLMIGCAEPTDEPPPESSSQSEEVVQNGEEDSVEESKPDLTPGQENALQSAENYLDLMAFSKSGLIEQLEFEKYSTEDAKFAVDSLDVDWSEQAARSAEEYLDSSSFSRQGLIDQLEFEGFTSEQAEFGVDQAGL